MSGEFGEALTEVHMILKVMPNEIINKIPESFKNFVLTNKSHNYVSEAIDGKFITETKLKKDTKSILSLIYRSYLCDEKKKNELKEQDLAFFKRLEEEKKQKYDVNNLFLFLPYLTPLHIIYLLFYMQKNF